MTVLITGNSHTGKTLPAQRVPGKYKYPYFFIYNLKRGLIRSGNTHAVDEVREYETDYVGVPKASSENRRYIPMDYFSNEIIPGDKLFMMKNAAYKGEKPHG